MKTFQPHTPRTGALLTSLLVNAVLLGGVLTQFAHGAGQPVAVVELPRVTIVAKRAIAGIDVACDQTGSGEVTAQPLRAKL